MGMGYGFGGRLSPALRPIRTEPADAIAPNAPLVVMTATQLARLPESFKPKRGRPKGSKNKPKTK